MAGINVIAADTTAAAQVQREAIRRLRAVSLYGRQLGVRDQDMTDEQADQLLAAGASVHVDHMLTYTAAGTPREVSSQLDEFAVLTGADELITVHQSTTMEGRMRSVTLLAEAVKSGVA
jgi:alkanesulfonate monooxygenase SsuD/methylene tetrahydromethanopterin reductase-like flavin-dependent oxidoreductase (luciferase family)